jgi:hypothetical protein
MSDLKSRIAAANLQTVDTILRAQPIWVDVRPALDVVPGMAPNMILHSSPRIEWERMCGAQRNGIIGAALFEKLAPTREEAIKRIEKGEILFDTCHNHAAVGAGAGIVSAATPMVVIENKGFGNRAFCPVSESGALQALKWGWYDEKVELHLRWLADVFGPVLQAGIQRMGGLDVKSILAKAVQMGDECHNRSVAASHLFYKELMPHLLRCDVEQDALLQSVDFLSKMDHFFLHVTMAAGKAMIEPARNIPYSCVVTAMARNGVEFGIQVSGLGDEWFRAPANPVDGLFFRAEWGPDDAALDLGDSSITEVIGLGGMIQATAPTVQQYVKGSMADAVRNTAEAREICVGVNHDLQIPNLDFAGAPIGIDIRKVVQTGITPILDTAITNKMGGLIGAGQARAPKACFDKALRAFLTKYATS